MEQFYWFSPGALVEFGHFFTLVIHFELADYFDSIDLLYHTEVLPGQYLQNGSKSITSSTVSLLYHSTNTLRNQNSSQDYTSFTIYALENA